jgi:hypothetical protein
MVTILGANSVSGGYEIDNSLRFNDGDSPYLSFTTDTDGNDKIATFSAWIKRGSNFANQQNIFTSFPETERSHLLFTPTNDQLHFQAYTGDSATTNLITNRAFRDPSAWYHIVLAFDTTQGTDTNRIKIYVNGVQETSFATETYPSQDTTLSFNTDGRPFYIGTYNTSLYFFDGYMSEINWIDGTQKAASDFGEVDDNGVWIPKAYTGTYGTNGFYLEFKQTGTGTDASGMGADTSGNDNHFAVTNLVASDVVIDTPTNNFATMNPLLTDTTTVAFSEGNLKTVCTNASTAGSSIAVQNGKWYVEMICTAKTATNAMIGICTVDGFDGQKQLNESDNGGSGYGYVMNGNKLGDGGGAYGVTWAVDDIMAVALDLDTAQHTVTFYKNNASQGTIDIDNALYVFANSNGQGSSTVTINNNFGADDTFAGEIASAGNTDANGYGLFKYTPPSGYYSLCTKNLAEFG